MGPVLVTADTQGGVIYSEKQMNMTNMNVHFGENSADSGGAIIIFDE